MKSGGKRDLKKYGRLGPQVRFVVASMSAFLLISIITITAINIFSYIGTMRDADGLLEILEENDGEFPKPDREPEKGKSFEAMRKNGMSPELPYESRFFSVLLDAQTGQVLSTETRNIASIDADGAAELAAKAYGRGERGVISQYRYLKTEKDGTVNIIFLDIWRQLEFIQRFFVHSVSISLICFLIVLALISYFSRRIIGPVLESYEKQKRFITDAGHEIKTPLAIISADADVLELEFDAENEWIADIKKQTRHLTDLTNDLVYLARMEENDRPASMIDFPLSDVVEDDVQSFQVVARTQGKRVVGHIQPDIVFCGDEKAIRELIEILLDNAIKYSPKDTQIDVELRTQGRNVCLSVTNETESELTREDLERVFERFYRGDKSRNSRAGGTGIGLSIAKAVVEAHKGSIRATREEDGRIKFTVII